MPNRRLPSWEQAEASALDQAASPLETFIYEYEPAGEDADDFRKMLSAVLNYDKAHTPKFIQEWEPEEEYEDFRTRLQQMLAWRRAFAAGSPDVVWVP